MTGLLEAPPTPVAIDAGTRHIGLPLEATRALLEDAIDRRLLKTKSEGFRKRARSPSKGGKASEDRFAPSITARMAELKRNVERLTADQIQVLHQLRYRNTALITGCAGSGKTLLVAEKAIRLDAAGLRPLILCHNPNVAHHIRSLVANPAIGVSDIATFVNGLAGAAAVDRSNWTAFEEPLDHDLERAMTAICPATAIYEAVIVDEGQDFRETWWVLISALLEHSRSKILYIFCDDNQALLPYRAKYPISGEPVSMSKNCRNGGNIFEVVRRFHRDAPLVSNFLTKRGIAKVTPVDEHDLRVRLEEALLDAYEHANPAQICVITNEPSAESSQINGFEFVRQTQYRWRVAVEGDLRALRAKALRRLQDLRSGNSHSEIANRFDLPLGRSFESYLSAPQLSQELLPTDEDVFVVRQFAAKLIPFFEGKRASDVRFTTRFQRLYLCSTTHTGKEVAANDASKVWHYAQASWASSLQMGGATRISADPLSWSDEDVVPLYSVGAFKGLECDALVLFVNSVSQNLFREMYVGSSRAVCYLHVVISRTVLVRLTSLEDLDSSILQSWSR